LLKLGDEKGYGSASGTLFSSQSEGEHTDNDAKSVSSRRSRRSIAGEERLPKLIETLGLCYLGAVLLRLPASLGDFFRWAAEEETIYTRAVSFRFAFSF
jgi:RNA polymerase I-specific transcription initiation factor RRN7